MKMMTVEVVVAHDDNQIEIAGRCCRDPIAVGDELSVDSSTDTLLRVLKIEVYRKDVLLLHHGYVGTLFAELIRGELPPLNSFLVGESTETVEKINAVKGDRRS